MAKWIPHTKGAAGEPSFEICVVREDNKFGQESFGWFGQDKILVTHNGGPCSWPLRQAVWDRCVKVAEELATELNDQEK